MGRGRHFMFLSEIDDRHSGDNRAQLEDLFVLGRHRGECIEENAIDIREEP
jgi:hypothetical protein